jgi:hypothetical protein
MRIPRPLTERVFDLVSEEDFQDWLSEVERSCGGVVWKPVGGIDNNVHTVEVSSDPALALVERPTNSIDALLDLKARELGETASSPHEAARRWWDVPKGGLSEMSDRERRDLADLIRVTMRESGLDDTPTIEIQDRGTGQHPDDFSGTLLSLLASNKKSSTHVMGVYNAGGAATYKFASATIVASRLSPTLLEGRTDEVGVTAVRYNPLDPDRFKSGVYEYVTDRAGSVFRLDLDELPDLGFGTFVKLIEYQLPRYARGAHEPKQSLWHLFHAALPDPALPFRIIETRVDRFPGLKGTPTRRVVSGLLHLLQRTGTADYSDEREIDLGPDNGRITLRYFVLNDGTDPDAYTTSEQGLTITLNGQRQITKDRLWLRRNLELFYIYKRLVVLVDGTSLSSAARRRMFASTRETGVDTPLAKSILDRVVQELLEDESLDALDELAKQRALADATKSTTDKVKRQLASQIAAYLKGDIGGKKGGGRQKKRKKRCGRPGPPPNVDDSAMLEVPDRLAIISDPVVIQRGGTASLRLEINAKNGFLPRYASGLSVVIGSELKDFVHVYSKGRLVGGRVRVTLEASDGAPAASDLMKVALVIEELGVLLTAEAKVEVVEPKEEDDSDSRRGGEPNIDVRWVGRNTWEAFDPPWNEEMVGDCIIYRGDDPDDKTAITKVEWILNEGFGPYERVISEKRLGELALKSFKEGYEYPVLYGLFKQRLAEEAKEREADEEGRGIEVPDDYVRGEKARLARAVLMAKEPDIDLAERGEVG